MYILLKLTNRCNLNCNYCSFSSVDSVVKSDIDIDSVIRFLSIVCKHTKVVNLELLGGEPTMYSVDKLSKLINNLRNFTHTQFNISMTSNGELLKNNIDRIKTYVDLGIKIGISNQLCNKYVTPEFKSLVEDIYSVTGESVNVTTVISKFNQHNLIDLHESFRSISDICYHSFLMPMGNFDNMCIDIECIREYFRYSINASNDAYTNFVSALVGKLVSIKGDCSCSASDCSERFLTVLQDGTLTYCVRPYINTVKEYDFISIDKVNSFEDIYNNRGYIEYCTDIVSKMKICKKCELRNYCKNACHTEVRYHKSRNISECPDEIYRREMLLMNMTYDELKNCKNLHYQIKDRLLHYRKTLPENEQSSVDYVNINKEDNYG